MAGGRHPEAVHQGLDACDLVNTSIVLRYIGHMAS
jgi:hypothetical protein